MSLVDDVAFPTNDTPSTQAGSIPQRGSCQNEAIRAHASCGTGIL